MTFVKKCDSSKDTAKFLSDNGLLFEINRQILHPLGLAMYVQRDEDTGLEDGVMGVYVDQDAGGIVFDPDTYNEGIAKTEKYMEETRGYARIAQRVSRYGFKVQNTAKTFPDLALATDKPLRYYAFHVDCGRGGELHGQFLLNAEEQLLLEDLYGRDVSFGEVLGKHSDVTVHMTRKHITLITEDQVFLARAVALNIDLDSGFNPLQHSASEHKYPEE